LVRASFQRTKEEIFKLAYWSKALNSNSPHFRKPLLVFRNENRIFIRAMTHPARVSDFLKAIQYGQKLGHNDFLLNFSEVGTAYADVCAPFAGIIDYYKKSGVTFALEGALPPYLAQTRMLEPIDIQSNTTLLSNACLDKIWRFANSTDIKNCVDCYVQTLSQSIECEKGVLEAIEWCTNEIMDNVIQHSDTFSGLIMCQVHNTRRRVAFCVYDSGRGIYNSLRNSIHAPKSPLDAISLAIKEGVTRDKDVGQGNGMWGLYNMVRQNSGRLTITSASASWMMTDNNVNTYNWLPYISKTAGSTTVDFQLDVSKKILIEDALSTGTQKYQPTSIYLDKFETESTYLHYPLKDQSSGTGTRQSGQRIRLEILNLYNTTKKPILISFESVAVISSSFADELIGKLVVHFGFMGFNQVIRLLNMNPTIQAIVNRSVSQRMSDSFVEGSAST
jgi:STAS-like domain of unknown function (DUF4325)